MGLSLLNCKTYLEGMTSNEKASKPPLHVIVGAGQIGPNIAARLLERGLRVRLVQRRTPSTAGLAGVETARADVSDPDSAARAFEGASVVYHTANPVYTEWPRLLLPLTRGIAAGATRAGAHLVVLELRAEAAHVLLTARDRGELAVTIGRASDFFGPGATLSAIFGPRFWQRALRGKPGEVFGDPNQPHSYSYVRDVADALVTLGTDERAKNRLWHLPVNPAEPTRTTIARAARALGIELGAKRFAPRLLSLLGVVSPMLREVAEMTYQWEAPFVLDDSRFRDTFGVTATPWDPAMNETAAWGRTLGRS